MLRTKEVHGSGMREGRGWSAFFSVSSSIWSRRFPETACCTSALASLCGCHRGRRRRPWRGCSYAEFARRLGKSLRVAEFFPRVTQLLKQLDVPEETVRMKLLQIGELQGNGKAILPTHEEV